MGIKNHIIALTLAATSMGVQASDTPKSGKIRYDHPRILEMCRYHQNKTGILLDGKEICEYSKEHGSNWGIITKVSAGVVTILGCGSALVLYRRRQKIEKKIGDNRTLEECQKAYTDSLEKKRRQAQAELELYNKVIINATNQDIEAITNEGSNPNAPVSESGETEVNDVIDSDVLATESGTCEIEADNTNDEKPLDSGIQEPLNNGQYHIHSESQILKELDVNTLRTELQGQILEGEELNMVREDELNNRKIINLPQINAIRQYNFSIKYNNQENSILLSAIDPENNGLYYLDENGDLQNTTEYAFQGLIGFHRIKDGYFRIILPDYTTKKIFLQGSRY